MPESLTPSRLTALRRHIAGGGQLGNTEAQQLLATFDELLDVAGEENLLLMSLAPCHMGADIARIAALLRSYQGPEPTGVAEASPTPATRDFQEDAAAALEALATDPGIAAAEEAGRRRLAEWATRYPIGPTGQAGRE